MQAYQFNAEIKNGAIKVPEEYMRGKPSEVKVILLPSTSPEIDKASLFPDLKLKTNLDEVQEGSSTTATKQTIRELRGVFAGIGLSSDEFSEQKLSEKDMEFVWIR